MNDILLNFMSFSMISILYGPIHKIRDARGGRGCLIRSHIVSQEGGGASQAVSRDGEVYREKFIPVYNKTRPCLQICVSMFSIKILLLTSPWNTALPFIQQTSENLSGKLFRLRFNKALK